MKKQTLLITGFDPFGGESINPAWEAVKCLPEEIGPWRLHKMQLPTVFEKASCMAIEAAENIQPGAILCIGQAGGRTAVTPERIAVNIRDARIPDNAGNQPVGQLVAEDGPAAYFSTVPVMQMAAAIQARNIPSTVSNSAGAFVCNDLLYTLLHHFDGTGVKVGFIHVPYLPQQGEPSLALPKIMEALAAAIEAC